MNGTADNTRVDHTLDARPAPAVGQTVHVRHNGEPAIVTKVTRFPGDVLVDVRMMMKASMQPCLFLDGLRRTPGSRQWLAP